jgi:GDP-L-fucose synthase
MYKDKLVLVTGSEGFLGKHLCNHLKNMGASVFSAKRNHADLLNYESTRTLFECVSPNIVIHCAVQGGGIGWMKNNAVSSGKDNLRINLNSIEAAYEVGVESFIGVSSACIYPKFGTQPFQEDEIWEGYPEPLNGHYALSKRMMMDLGKAYANEKDFHCVFPILANLYGPNDHLTNERAHVVSDLMIRCAANPDELIVWGTGEAQREFLYIEDAAEGILACLKAPAGEFVNIGTGRSTSILDLSKAVLKAHGVDIPIRFDPTKPNGQLRKVLSVEKAKKILHWESKISLETGLKRTALWYRKQLI